MSSKHLRNVPLRLYRDFLKSRGCQLTRTSGGHEHWTRADLLRPITIQAHVDPVPEFVIKNGIRQLGLTKKDFLEFI